MSRHPLSFAFSSLAVLYRAYHSTLQVSAFQADGSPTSPETYPYERKLFALCERDAAALAGFFTRHPFLALVSPGRDGDWATAAIERLGCRVVRGSSRRGGARALSELVHALSRSDLPAAIVVDGPLGPAGQAKPGILLCARHAGRSIVPLGAAARRSLVLTKAWSRLFVPLPFTRLAIVCGPSLEVPQGAGREELAALATELSRRLAFSRAKAEEALAKGAAFALPRRERA